jgi:hypothetical protein
MTRFTTDGSSTAAQFGNGTISSSANSLAWGNDPGATFLDVWSRLATREGFMWRYTPQPYVVGTRTLGTVDYEADPGTDRSNSIIFRQRDGNLLSLTLDDNADPYTASSEVAGLSTLDGGGIAYFTDIATLQSIGAYEDQLLAGTHSDFNSLSHAARNILSNKVKVGSTGNKTATVLRDALTADKFRELDKVTLDWPALGINNASARVLVRQVAEGITTETLTLDQFSWHGREFDV